MTEDIPSEENFKSEIEIYDNFKKSFFDEDDDHKKTKILNSFVESYFIHHKSELDAEFINPTVIELLSQIPVLCGNFLITTTSKSSIRKETSPGSSENRAQCLESAGLCFGVILKCSKACKSTEIMKLAINMLTQGYVHCKNSELIYGELLDHFANQLGIFFKSIENLQMVVLQQLENLCQDPLCPKEKNEQHISMINSVIQEMANLCEVVSYLDLAEFDLWTMLIKIVSKHRNNIQQFGVYSSLTYLNSKTLEIIDTTIINFRNPEQDEDMYKILVFYLNVLLDMLNLVQLNLCKPMEMLSDNYRTLLLHLFELFVSCFYPDAFAESSLDCIKECLVKIIFPLMSILYKNEEFLRLVLSLTASDAEGYHSGLILLKLCSLQFMKNKAEDDANMILINLPQCAITESDSMQLIGLYEFASDQMRDFLKSLPDSVIQRLEETILKYTKDSSDLISMLVSDVWIYRLRCSNVEFLRERCHSVLKNKFQTSTDRNFKIESLLKRMLKFLPQNYLEMLLQEFSCLRSILSDQKIQHRHGTPDLHSIENKVIPDNPSEMIQEMMQKLGDSNLSDEVKLVQKACLCLELCTAFVNASGSAEILQFLEFAAKSFTSDVHEVQIAVLTFIKALGTKNVPENSHEYGKIVTCMAQLFSEAIHSKNYIVKFEALNTFRNFAKCTPHIRIVQEIARRDPSLKPIIKSYLSVDSSNFLTEEQKSQYLQQQISMFNETNFELSGSSKHILENIVK